MIEYLDNLWYSINRIEQVKGGIFNMYETTMKSFYEQVSGDKSNHEPKFSLWLKKLSDYISAWHFYKELKKETKKKDFSLYIIQNKEICNGKPIIKDTRIQPVTVVRCMKKSKEKNFIQFIKEEYPTLKEDEILIAILYYINKTSFKKFLSL